LWTDRQDFARMAFSDNNSDKIENPVIGFRLPRQASKGISIALNLESVEATVHDSEIDAAVPVT